MAGSLDGYDGQVRSSAYDRIPCPLYERCDGANAPRHHRDPSVETGVTQRVKKPPPPQEVVAAIVDLADDGFCRRSDLALRFPGLSERDLRRALRRAVALGLVIERRGPEGGFHLAVSSEGWNLHRDG